MFTAEKENVILSLRCVSKIIVNRRPSTVN